MISAVGTIIAVFGNASGVLDLGAWANWLLSHWYHYNQIVWAVALGWTGIVITPLLASFLASLVFFSTLMLSTYARTTKEIVDSEFVACDLDIWYRYYPILALLMLFPPFGIWYYLNNGRKRKFSHRIKWKKRSGFTAMCLTALVVACIFLPNLDEIRAITPMSSGFGGLVRVTIYGYAFVFGAMLRFVSSTMLARRLWTIVFGVVLLIALSYVSTFGISLKPPVA